MGVRHASRKTDMRRLAKTINFGIIYGMGAQRLARQTGLSQRQAEAFIEQYFRVFSGVRAWLDRTREEATRTGTVSTLTGRRRRLEGLDGGDPRTTANALNMAVNTPLQGTAADLIKIAMVRVAARLRERRLPARMILTVHDELVFEVESGALEEARAEVVATMQSAMELDVPLVVDAEGVLIAGHTRLKAALKLGQGRVSVHAESGKVQRFSSALHCAQCDIQYAEPTPAAFSFNSPIGACEACRGFGRVIGVDFGLVIPFRRFRPLVWIVTSFTVAHSITLIASALDLAPDAPEGLGATLADYDLWRANFGLSAAAAAGGTLPFDAAVPEPTTGFILTLAAIFASSIYARRRT